MNNSKGSPDTTHSNPLYAHVCKHCLTVALTYNLSFLSNNGITMEGSERWQSGLRFVSMKTIGWEMLIPLLETKINDNLPPHLVMPCQLYDAVTMTLCQGWECYHHFGELEMLMEYQAFLLPLELSASVQLHPQILRLILLLFHVLPLQPLHHFYGSNNKMLQRFKL